MNENTLMTESTPENANDGTSASQNAEGQQPVTAEAQGNEQQATEGQSQESQQANEAKTEGESKEAEKLTAPEKYEFKAPEGQQFDPQVIEAYSEIAKELNLPQESAQKIIDKIAPVMAEKQMRVMEQARNEWAEATRSDKEFGGDKLDENLAAAKSALKAFGNDSLTNLLNESGLGNHPEVIRFMVKAGKAISEDGFVRGQRQSTANDDPAKRLFPNQA